MAIIPELTGVKNLGAIGADPSLSAAAAVGQGAAAIGQGVAALGQGVGNLMEKRQRAIDIGAKASVRLAIQSAMADHENFRNANPDKETEWAGDLQNRLGGIRAKLPEGISGDGQFEIENVLTTSETLGVKQTEGLAAAQGVKRARTQVMNAVDAYATAGDTENAVRQVEEGVGTLWTPEEKEAMIAKIKPAAAAAEVQRMIAVDPFLVAKSINERDKDGKPLHFADLPEDKRGILSRQAEARVSEIRSERFNGMMVDSLSGKFIEKDEAVKMAERGEWSYGQAFAYLNTLESNQKAQQEGKVDMGEYNNIYTFIQQYDPKADGTGKSAADLAAVIASAPLPTPHKKELIDQLNGKRTEETKILGEDKGLKSHITGIIKERFDTGKFGDWMKENPVNTDDDPNNDDENAPKIRDQEAWERANDRRYQITRDFDEWLKETKETDVGKAKEALDKISGFKPRANGFRFKPKTDGFNRLDDAAPTDVKKKDDGSTSYNLPAPLKPFESVFIEAAKANKLDPAFLMAVAMHETDNGKARVFTEGKNAMGISNRKGWVPMKSVEDSIWRQAKTLGNPEGLYKGARTIREIGAIYAPPNGVENDPKDLNKHWPSGVSKYYKTVRGAGSDTSFVASRSGAAAFPDPARIEGIDVTGKSWGEVQDDYWSQVGGGFIGDVDGELSSLKLRWMDQLVAVNEKAIPREGPIEELKRDAPLDFEPGKLPSI